MQAPLPLPFPLLLASSQNFPRSKVFQTLKSRGPKKSWSNNTAVDEALTDCPGVVLQPTIKTISDCVHLPGSHVSPFHSHSTC